MRERSQRFDPRQVMQRDTFEIFHYREPRPNGVEVHHHDFYEVYYLLRGEVEYWVDGRIIRMQPGDLLLINPQELHHAQVNPGGLYERIVLWVDRAWLERFSDENASLTRCFDRALADRANLLRPSARQRAALRGRLAELVQESYGEGGYAGAQYATAVLLQFMVELNRMAQQTAAPDRSSAAPAPLVSQVLEYIGANYGEELSLENLAQRFFVSKYHMMRQFRRETGTTVHLYITQKRLVKARELMDSGMRATEACYRCGWRSYSSFTRAYGKHLGTTPTGRLDAGQAREADFE